MRITLNLASKPWVDLGTLMRRLRIALISLAVVCVALLVGLHFEARTAQKAQAKRDAMDAQQAKLEREKKQFDFQLAQPANSSILERSQYLNQVFAEKSFSWTSVMMDLENVMPVGVQVASIDPQVMSDGSIVIRLRVNGDRERAVDLVRNLEKSKRFLAPRLASEASEAPTGGPQAVNFQANANSPVTFDIMADYNPLPANAAAEKKTLAATDSKKAVAAAADPTAPLTDAPKAKTKTKRTLPSGTAIHSRGGH